MAHPRNRQAGSKGKHVITNKRTARGLFVTGNSSEHTDSGLAVCTANGGEHKDKFGV
jgi:hypothetical protein